MNLNKRDIRWMRWALIEAIETQEHLIDAYTNTLYPAYGKKYTDAQTVRMFKARIRIWNRIKVKLEQKEAK